MEKMHDFYLELFTIPFLRVVKEVRLDRGAAPPDVPCH